MFSQLFVQIFALYKFFRKNLRKKRRKFSMDPIWSYVHLLCAWEVTSFLWAVEPDPSVRGVHMEVQTLSSGQLVSTQLASEVHLQLSFSPFLFVAFTRRLPGFIGVVYAFVVFEFLVCIANERAELTQEFRCSMNKPNVGLQQVQSCVCREIALVTPEDSSAVFHPYVLFQHIRRAKFLGTLLTHVLGIIVLRRFVDSYVPLECWRIVALVTIVSLVWMLPFNMQFEMVLWIFFSAVLACFFQLQVNTFVMFDKDSSTGNKSITLGALSSSILIHLHLLSTQLNNIGWLCQRLVWFNLGPFHRLWHLFWQNGHLVNFQHVLFRGLPVAEVLITVLIWTLKPPITPELNRMAIYEYVGFQLPSLSWDISLVFRCFLLILAFRDTVTVARKCLVSRHDTRSFSSS